MGCEATPTAANPPDIEALYPEGSIPSVRFDKVSALCAFGYTPRIMTGVLRQILLQHFANPDNVLSQTLRDFLIREGAWREGDDSPLLIESLARWKPNTEGARPAIILKEGDWHWQRIGIGDGAGQTWRDGKMFFAGLWQGTHTLFALGNEGAETQILASEVAKLLLWFGPLILEQMNLMRFVVVTIGALHALEECTEHYVVPITIAYTAEESWNIQEEAPRLKHITFTAEDLLG